MGAAGRTAVSVSTVDTAQELIDVFSEKHKKLDSARIWDDGRGTRSILLETMPDSCSQIKLLSKLDLRGGSIDTKCESRLLPIFAASRRIIPVEFTQKTTPEGISQKPSGRL